MATVANVEKVKLFCQILAYISPFYAPPSKPTFSRSVQTALIGRPPADQLFESADKSTQVSSNDLKPSKKPRSPSPSRSVKSANLDTVRDSRITKRSSKKPRRVTRCKGLRNSSQLCYQNSVFQFLFHMPGFVDYLDGIHNLPFCADHSAGLCVVCALKSF